MTTELNENETKAATVSAQGAAVAPEKATSKKTASPKKGAPKSQKGGKGAKPATKPKKATAPSVAKAAKPKPEGVRKGSKTAAVMELLQRKGAQPWTRS